MAKDNDVGVFVLGMHRSGTSAVAKAVNFLGLSLGDEEDLIPPASDNPRGFWESKTLTVLNDEILSALGGTWDAPPNPPSDWATNGVVSDFRARARDIFTALYPTSQWVWKDPRNCFTLPFWASVLDVAPVVVLVLRNPLEVWRWLERRNGLSKALSLALWERYLREALAASEGLPVFVTAFEDLLDDPDGWIVTANSFLSSAGVDTVEPDRSQLADFLESDLRHSRFSKADVSKDRDLMKSQINLFRTMLALKGVHEKFEAPRAPRQSIWTAEILRIHGDAMRAESTRADVSKLEDEREALASECQDLKHQVRSLTLRDGELDRLLLESQKELGARGAEVVALGRTVDEQAAQLSDQTAALQDRSARVEDLQRQCEGARVEQAEVRKVLVEIENRLGLREEDVRRLTVERDDLRAELDATRSEAAELQAKVEESTSILDERLAEIERLGSMAANQDRQIDRLSREQAEVQKVVVEIENRLSLRDEDVRRLAVERDDLRAELDATRSEAAELQAKVEESTSILDERLAEIERLGSMAANQDRQIDRVGRGLEGALLRQTELRRLLLESQDVLSRRDLEVRSVHEQLSGAAGERDALRTEVEALNSEVQSMLGTRVWRIGSRYWGARDRVKRLGRRRD